MEKEFSGRASRALEVLKAGGRFLSVIRLDGGAVLKWFSSKLPPSREGERIAGSAKVDKHSEFKGVKETLIKNPRWKEI